VPYNTLGVGNVGRFEQIVMPHLDAAYNLARCLVHDPQNAQDIVQESCLRAFKFFSGFQGGNARAWLLKIVRNTSYSFLNKNLPTKLAEEFDEKIHTDRAGRARCQNRASAQGTEKYPKWLTSPLGP
jgi:RNA polymerase sigma factor (sigma-70 family)